VIYKILLVSVSQFHTPLKLQKVWLAAILTITIFLYLNLETISSKKQSSFLLANDEKNKQKIYVHEFMCNQLSSSKTGKKKNKLLG